MVEFALAFAWFRDMTTNLMHLKRIPCAWPAPGLPMQTCARVVDPIDEMFCPYSEMRVELHARFSIIECRLKFPGILERCRCCIEWADLGIASGEKESLQEPR